MITDIQQCVKRFIVENFYVVDPASLAPTASLLDQGIVDSTGILEVTAFLEGELGITVRDDEITPENLDTIDRITAFVARKQAAALPVKISA